MIANSDIIWDYVPVGDGVTVMLPYATDRGEASPPAISHALLCSSPACFGGFSLSLMHRIAPFSKFSPLLNSQNFFISIPLVYGA